MAKGSAMGIWRGKKGSSVFYYLKNSNNSQKQGIRERVYEIHNPQTVAQIDQRMKMRPLSNLYNVIAPLARRAWQGVDYGGKGRQRFMKENLGDNTEVPFLNYGETRPIPGSYKISDGSIPAVTMDVIDVLTAATSLQFDSTYGNTWGEVSQNLIANNDLQDGDQITFIWCHVNSQVDIINQNYFWGYDSVYLDVNSVEDAEPALGNKMTLGAKEIDGSLYLGIETTSAVNAAALVAFGCIISRKGSTGTYMRSPCELTVNATLLAPWFTQSRYAAALATYQTHDTSSSNLRWVVDDESTRGGSTTRATSPGAYTLSGLTGGAAALNGTEIWVRRYDDDNTLAAVYVTSAVVGVTTYDDLMIKRSDNTVTKYVVDMQELPLQTQDVDALTNVPTLPWSGEPTS